MSIIGYYYFSVLSVERRICVWLTSRPAPPVFGTSITLHTEEDIAKWIAQRKAKFPSKERIAQKVIMPSLILAISESVLRLHADVI